MRLPNPMLGVACVANKRQEVFKRRAILSRHVRLFCSILQGSRVHTLRLATFTEQGELDDAAIFVRGNVIEWVGRDAELPSALSTADTVLELRDHVMIPGMSSVLRY